MNQEPIKLDSDGRKIIKPHRVRYQDLTEEENDEIRNFYWAAFYGKRHFLKIMIEELRWSPFIKTYKKRSIISGAILGK